MIRAKYYGLDYNLQPMTGDIGKIEGNIMRKLIGSTWFIPYLMDGVVRRSGGFNIFCGKY